MKNVRIAKKVLSDNDRLAADLRRQFRDSGVTVVNLLSSPGSGKTRLLERTAAVLGSELSMGVIEGDLQTERDADRVRKAGIQARQINTGGGCHLDATMVADALQEFDLDELDVLFIENVGNLVCPAAFDLGETHAVLLMSVTEGDDKPAKYPTAFLKADLVLLNKMDLVRMTDFSTDRFESDLAVLRPGLDVFPVSCTTTEGLECWYDWVRLQTDNGRTDAS